MTLRDAWQALERDDFAFAERTARETLPRSPDDGDAFYLLGSALLFAGRHAEALGPLEEAAARLRTRGVGYRLGHCRLALGDFQAAESALRRETELHPESANAQNTLGVALVRQAKHEQALAAFLAALRIEPTHAEARRNAAVARSQLVWNLISLCRWDEARPHVAALRAGVRDGTLGASPFTMIAVSPSP